VAEPLSEELCDEGSATQEQGKGQEQSDGPSVAIHRENTGKVAAVLRPWKRRLKLVVAPQARPPNSHEFGYRICQLLRVRLKLDKAMSRNYRRRRRSMHPRAIPRRAEREGSAMVTNAESTGSRIRRCVG